ncbi:LisH domain-containing protein [Balamuthia mandrillaris]
MEDARKAKEMDAAVLNYLKLKGYRQAEAIFKQESKMETEVSREQMAFEGTLDKDVCASNYIRAYNHFESLLSRYEDSYTHLREWIYASLDRYKNELVATLYPIFVHCYLNMVEKGMLDEAKEFMRDHQHEHMELHADELVRFQSVTTPGQLEENDLVRKFRTFKYNVKLCNYSYELLIGFLQQASFMLLLGIVNQYLNVNVFSGEPDEYAEQDYIAITGATEEELKNMNKKKVQWGLLQDRVHEYLPSTKDGTPAPTAAPEDKAAEEEKASKKAKVEVAPQQKPAVKTITSQIPLPTLNESVELQILEDIRKRVNLTSTALPSICFFTFLNTHQSLNCIEINKEGSLVAGGFADSSIKLWDLKKDHSRIFGESSSSSTGGRSKIRGRTTDYVPLLGHSGPVYACSFSPDNNFLISASEDNTARLWSMETRTNVVYYRGHNYPVWDVQFSPLGYYFATASHDRTARLWATDQIFPLRIFAGHLSDVDCVKFHPNCNYVATGSSDKSIRLWEVNSGACVRIFTGHYGPIYALAFSPDGRILASAGEDRSIILWDLASGKKLKTLGSQHEGTVWSLDFSAEGSLLASGSADQTVMLWDINKARGVSADSGGKKHSGSTASTSGSASTSSKTPAKKKTKRKKKERGGTTTELLKTFPTKKTPVYCVKFTRRNLLLCGGAFTKAAE